MKTNSILIPSVHVVDPSDEGFVKARFLATLKLLNTSTDAKEHERLWKRFRNKLKDPRRKYQTFGHLARCMRHADAVTHLAKRECVEAALLVHHITSRIEKYHSGETVFTIVAGFYDKNTSVVSDLVHCTTDSVFPFTHYGAGDDRRYISDIIYADLQAPWSDFLLYMHQIELEYKMRGRKDFAKDFGILLKQLIAQSKANGIFMSPEFSDGEMVAALNLNMFKGILLPNEKDEE